MISAQVLSYRGHEKKKVARGRPALPPTPLKNMSTSWYVTPLTTRPDQISQRNPPTGQLCLRLVFILFRMVHGVPASDMATDH